MRFSRSRSHSLPHSLVLSLPRSLDLSLPLSLPSHSPLSLPLSLVLSLVLSLCLACNGGQAPCDDDTSCPDTTAGGSQSSDASVTSDPGCGGACTGASETADTWTGGGLPPDLPSDLPSDPPPPAGVAWDFEAEPLGGAAIDAPLVEGGDVQGTIAWVSGQREAAIAARGRDGVVELVDAHAVDFGEDDSFRVDLTLRTARHGQGGEAGAGVVVSRGAPEDRGFSLRVRDGALVFSVWTEGQVSEVVSSALISDDRWHQVSAARDRALGELALVVDGFDVARAPDTSGALASDAPLWLLGVGDEGRLWGALDDLAVRPGAIEAPPPTPEWDDREVFAAGVDAAEGFSYAGFRIPAIVRVASGALVAFAEGRVDDTCDFGRIHVVSKRSVDGG
ncbi:MAG: hypothetical protein KC468_19480, partial [Myxococcales bacterium]|nr:hypothetical protein [Myxococcales bacterium]